MKFSPMEIAGVTLVEPDVYRDARGFLLESYHQKKYHKADLNAVFIQDNHSMSGRATLRGLHMQVERPQVKLVRVLRGTIWDVAVDVRRGSPTFGQHVCAELSDENWLQFYLPTGLLHGFVVLSEEAEIEYKCSAFYDPASELCVRWNDPDLAIPWPVESPRLSPRDAEAPSLSDVMDRLPRWQAD